MALVTSNQFQLVPDIGQVVSRGLQVAGGVQQLQSAQQAQKQAEQRQKFQTRAVNALRLQGLPVDQQIKELERQQTQASLTGEVPPENQELLNLLKQGRTEEANQFITKAVDIGQRLGVINPPEPITVAPGEEISEVQSSKILPGGLVQIVRKNGTTEVVPAKKAEAVLVKEAEIRGAKLQGLRAGERGAASESQKLAISTFKKLAPIKKSIRNLEEGIRLIDEGAKTGVIASKLPSVKAASVKLDNVQAQLGLDVIGNTTFGALSESELQFALSSALPKKLSPPELRKWLSDKREAQRKLADYVEEAAIFLGTPGNNISDFLRQKGAQQAPAIPQPTPQAAQPQRAGRFTIEVVE